MEHQLTPEDAVRRAFWTVKVPSMTVLLLPLVSLVLLIRLGFVPDKGKVAMMWAIPTFIISFVGGWLVWSIQVPRWRLWAYRHVSDISALKEIALEAGIIWDDKSIFGKTEILSKKVREELISLERKSSENDA